jgi:uncharacterized protein with HEPN domain
MPPSFDRDRIQHMIAAVDEILEFTQGLQRRDLDGNRPLQHLLVRNLEVLGEAAGRVRPELRASYPQIAWREMIDTRNRLIHAYFDIDLDIIWRTVQEEIPILKATLPSLLDDGH